MKMDAKPNAKRVSRRRLRSEASSPIDAAEKNRYNKRTVVIQLVDKHVQKISIEICPKIDLKGLKKSP
jgi:hypothetical protein